MDHPEYVKNTGKIPSQPVTGQKNPARILVAPLDWGLGHTSRCIPLIRELLARQAEVWLAGDEVQKNLLLDEFPGLPFLPLEGYNIRYAGAGRNMTWKMIRQIPKINKAIRRENEWLKNAVTSYHLNAVISDNRYGLFHASLHTVFITHQLAIKSPMGAWSEKLLQKRNYNFINRFSECWIPDQEQEPSLAGSLSHPFRKPVVPVKYIGPLSRLTPGEVPVKKNHLLVLLSGPEPQRSILEEKILQDISRYPYTATVVRGLPGHMQLIPSSNSIQLYNHLPAARLNWEMLEAEYVICRSGYSSLMDAMLLHKKCILIPTPGQTEQEYLADLFYRQQWAYPCTQADFSLMNALTGAAQFSYRFPLLPAQNPLADAINHLLHCLQ